MIVTLDPDCGLDPPFGGAQERPSTNPAPGAGSKSWAFTVQHVHSNCSRAALRRENDAAVQFSVVQCKVQGLQVFSSISLHVDSASPSRAANPLAPVLADRHA